MGPLSLPLLKASAMTGKAEIAHKMPGRIRIKVPSARGNLALLESSRHVFDGIPGLQSVVMKPDSGSILLNYDVAKTEEFEAILWHRWKQARPPKPHKAHKAAHHLERPGDEIDEMVHSLEAEAEFLAQRSHLARVLVDFFKDFDRQVKLVTNNAIDIKIVLALGLAVITFVEIGAEAATPMWVTLALFALNHFLEMHPPQAVAKAPAAKLG